MKPFPYYQQSYAKDCGPTCLKMIAEFHGKIFDPSQMSGFSRICLKGISLLGIMQAAKKIGFHTIGVKGSSSFLHQIDLPVILHWNQDHFVVLFEIKNNTYSIADPQHGLLKYDTKEFMSHWLGNKSDEEGVILILSPI